MTWRATSARPYLKYVVSKPAPRLITWRQGLDLSTFQLNLSRVCHKTTPYTPGTTP